MYRFLIIEDDPAAADKLEQFVTRYLGERGIDAAIDKLSTAFEFIELKQHYDLVFMDIDLPGINGMEAAAMLRERDHDTLLVFVTDLAKYAVKGYEVDALDFIVKPISYQGIALRMDRVARALEARPSKSIAVSGRQGVSVFPARDLIYAEVRGHYLTFHLSNGQIIEARGSLKACCEQNTLPQFIQISSGYVVNADNVRLIDGQTVKMSNGDDLIMSRPKRRDALASFARYYGGN